MYGVWQRDSSQIVESQGGGGGGTLRNQSSSLMLSQTTKPAVKYVFLVCACDNKAGEAAGWLIVRGRIMQFIPLMRLSQSYLSPR